MTCMCLQFIECKYKVNFEHVHREIRITKKKRKRKKANMLCRHDCKQSGKERQRRSEENNLFVSIE